MNQAAVVEKIAANFDTLAQNMQKAIDAKRKPHNWNTTHRRMQLETSMHLDAERMEETQIALRALAEAWRENRVPTALRNLRYKNQVEYLMTRSDMGDTTIFKGTFINKSNYDPARTQIKILSGVYISNHGGNEQRQEQQKQQEIKQQERDAVLSKIPGFFPTPPSVIEKMMELAAPMMRDGLLIMEPSAGKGNLVDAVRELAKRCNVSIGIGCYEINQQLCEILRKKGRAVSRGDFLQLQPIHPTMIKNPETGQMIEQSNHISVDLILMNPPFEGLADIDHVKHAYDFLAPGGRLIAIMGEGAFFRQDNKAKAFREWLDYEQSMVEKLPADAFKNSERPTGVQTRLVVIDK